MLSIPAFDSVAIVGDQPNLVAEIASLFSRPRRYLPILDGPRMARSDWSNEVIRRINALARSQCRRVLLADLPMDSERQLLRDNANGNFVSVRSLAEATANLRGCLKIPTRRMAWGNDDLGVGLLLARRSHQCLDIVSSMSSTTAFISGGRHLLIVCEGGNELTQITASSLAFAMDSSFLVIPRMPEEVRDELLEEIYSLGSTSDLSRRFADIRDRIHTKLPSVGFEKYKQVLFVTNGFPWGIAIPERPTTHLFSYPDLGRCIIEGLWAASQPSRGARNALLISTQYVEGSEMDSIAQSLYRNGTLIRVQAGQRATVAKVHLLAETLPFDIIAISTHAGDVAGERITYQFKDSEGISRRLVIDHAVGFGYDPQTDKVLVQQYHRFHELDGVLWADKAAKAKLYVGAAINSWTALGDTIERNKYKVSSVSIPRIVGSMALQLHDGVWFPMLHAFSPSCSPLILNNACSSWHELSKRLTFAGARAYLGTLFPVTDIEAQEVGIRLFGDLLGMELPVALWKAQNAVYGNQERRPYAMVGLPFSRIPLNTVDSYAYMGKEYRKAIAEYGRRAMDDPSDELRQNFQRYKDFLIEDQNSFMPSAMPKFR